MDLELERISKNLIDGYLAMAVSIREALWWKK